VALGVAKKVSFYPLPSTISVAVCLTLFRLAGGFYGSSVGSFSQETAQLLWNLVAIAELHFD